MKRLRFPALILAFLMAATLVFSPRTQAATYNGEQVYYTVINDSLIDLTYATMPIYRNGIIYIPYTVLSDNFDIRATYSSDEQVLFLSNGDTMIKFDIGRQKSYDNNQKELRQPALTAKGQVFVPAKFTANYLGLGYVYLADASIVRLGDYRVSYPDAFLASYLEEEMRAALDTLLNGSSTASSGTTVASATTTVQAPRNLCLSFLSASPENTQAILELLQRYDLTAAFFLDSARIAADPLDAVSLRVYGQVLGVYADATALPEEVPAADAPSEDAQDGPDISIDAAVDTERVLRTIEGVNDRYYALLREKSRLLLLDNADSPELRSLGRSAGYLSCSPTHRFTAPEDAQTLIRDVTQALEDAEGDVCLLLSDDAVTVQAFHELIAALRRMEFTFADADALGSGLAE